MIKANFIRGIIWFPIFLIQIINFSCVRENSKNPQIRWPLTLTNSLTDSCQFNQAFFSFEGYKVVHFVNADCSICLYDFYVLDSIMEEFVGLDCKLFAIAYGSRQETISYYLDQAHFQIPIFWDREEYFLNSKIIVNESPVRTLLIDRNNNIVTSGNFTRNKFDIKRFLKYLE